VRYTIIATLGPASAQAEQWSALLDAGVSAFRLNTSHLTLDALSRWLQSLDDFSRRRGEQTPLILDLQGSKWRWDDSNLVLNPGDSVVLIHSAEAIEPGTLPVPHADFFRAALRSSGRISINDARSVLAVESVGDDRVVARGVAGGTVSPRKGITFVDSDYRLEVLNEADRLAGDLTASLDEIRYAVSYVRDGHEMKRYRDLLGKDRHLIAKLERPAGACRSRQSGCCQRGAVVVSRRSRR
jgi:pyruvate kinase